MTFLPWSGISLSVWKCCQTLTRKICQIDFTNVPDSQFCKTLPSRHMPKTEKGPDVKTCRAGHVDRKTMCQTVSKKGSFCKTAINKCQLAFINAKQLATLLGVIQPSDMLKSIPECPSARVVV